MKRFMGPHGSVMDMGCVAQLTETVHIGSDTNAVYNCQGACAGHNVIPWCK